MSKIGVVLFLFVTTLATLVLSVVWYLAPYWFGMLNWTTNSIELKIALGFYFVSWWVGIPMLLISQVIAIVMGVMGRRRVALLVPIVSIGLFLLCVSVFLLLAY